MLRVFENASLTKQDKAEKAETTVDDDDLAAMANAKKAPKKPVVDGIPIGQHDIEAPECFGVLSFLLGSDAVDAELTSTSDQVVANVIEGYFLGICFGMRHGYF